MKDGLRPAMSWLHTWCGLICGWLLCAIFLTGTLSVFREPITRWMQAQPMLEASTPPDAAGAVASAAAQGLRYLEDVAAGAPWWRIELPMAPGDAMQVAWRDAAGSQERWLDPTDGRLLPQPWGRASEGGRHFMKFHYMLHLPVLGYWLVGALSIGMLIALLSGLVIHRRIFQDFFCFRPGKRLRSWMDAHNVCAVLALPFLFMIVYTGLAVFYISYMPWPLQALYGGDAKALNRYQAALASNHGADVTPAGVSATAAEPAAWLARACELLPQAPGKLLITRPGQSDMSARVIGFVDPARPSGSLDGRAASVTFDGASGAVLRITGATSAPMTPHQVHTVMESLHFAHFGGWGMKWMYFVSGLLGTAMMATGTIMFSVKRRQSRTREFGAASARIYRLAEALNVAALAGICVASIAYFYANRLLPAAMSARADWEIRLFLLVWLATAVHALCRSPRQAWIEQLGLGAMLCLGLPWLNAAVTGQHLLRYLAAGDMQRAAVEFTVIGLGALLGWMAYRTARGWQVAPGGRAS